MNLKRSIFQKKFFIFNLPMFFFLLFLFCSPEVKEKKIIENYTCFKTSFEWNPNLDLQTDLVLINFNGDSSQFFKILQSWQHKDYKVGGIFSINHDKILDNSEEKNLKDLLISFINKGFKTIVLEEISYELNGKYSPTFQEYWKKETGTQWIEPADSADIWYRAAKLKQKCFFNFLERLSTFLKEYAVFKEYQVDIFVSSISSITATSQDKVTPGSRTFQLSSVDGVIGKKESIDRSFVYQNKKQDKPFPNAYFNASWFFNCMDQTNKQIFSPVFSQNEFAANWISDVTVAALMQPLVNQFEFTDASSGHSSSQKFQLGLLTFIIESLHQIPPDQIHWSNNPWPKTGIIFSDTYMFGRGSKWSCALESFYQQAMPFLERGVPVQIVPLERVADEAYLDQFDVLYMTYEGYKPMSSELHNHLQRWVYKRGGVLFFYMGVTGAFDEIEEWWAANYDRPHEHLFELLKTGLYPESGMHKVGRGLVYTERNSPKELTKTPRGGEIIWNTYTEILMSYVEYDSTILETKNGLYLERGPYHLIFVPEATDSFSVAGNFIDLFSDDLVIINEKQCKQNDVGMLLNIDYFPKDSSAIVCSSSKISNVISNQNSLEFFSYWIEGTSNITYLRLANQPREISCQNDQAENVTFKQIWNSDNNVLRLEVASIGRPLHFKIVK